jgi:hypothetical protein
VSALADDWRQVLIEGGEEARRWCWACSPGAGTFTLLGKPCFALRGAGSQAGPFSKGFSVAVRPHRVNTRSFILPEIRRSLRQDA